MFALLSRLIPTPLSICRLTCCLAATACAPAGHGYTFDTVVALGDSLFRDGSQERSPVAAEHVADRLAAPVTILAQGGATSGSLISQMQHTTAAADFGSGDLALPWIGGNDFLDNDTEIAAGSFDFIDTLEANVDTILGTLRTAGLEVAVLNLPDMGSTPGVSGSVPAASLPNFSQATLDWNARLDILATTHEAVLVDVFVPTSAILADPDAFSVLGRTPIAPPETDCFMCLFHDNVHPSRLAQAFVANLIIEQLNTRFDPNGTMPVATLLQTQIAVLADIVLGDFNGDFEVDSSDYDAWQLEFLTSGTSLADGNGDYLVNAADYTIWRDNSSAAAGAAVVNQTVPEPLGSTQAAILLVLLLRRACRFRVADRSSPETTSMFPAPYSFPDGAQGRRRGHS